MTEMLIKVFVKDFDPTNPESRKNAGTLASVVGMICNLVLFVGKLLIGALSGSISITADAFNNLSDMGSCFIALFGMRLAARPADKDHPFGHGRYEYLATMGVAVVILFVAVELAKSSVEKLLHPQAATFSIPLVIVLVLSILVKLWMCFFNKKLGRKLNSGVIEATAKDSLNDVIATSVVFVTLLIAHLFGFSDTVSGIIDGAVGLLVALFILWSGIVVIKENLGFILGEAPDMELVNSIVSRVNSYEGILGIHDMIVHNYGPSMYIATLHAEVSAGEDVLVSHDLIDRIEREISDELGILLTIHMDPILTDCEKTRTMKEKIQKLAHAIEDGVTIHDFRMVEGTTHTNLIFDAVLPYGSHLTQSELKEKLTEAISAIDESWYAVITIDREFI